jgi:hypothetical protein
VRVVPAHEGGDERSRGEAARPDGQKARAVFLFQHDDARAFATQGPTNAINDELDVCVSLGHDVAPCSDGEGRSVSVSYIRILWKSSGRASLGATASQTRFHNPFESGAIGGVCGEIRRKSRIVLP